MKFYLYWGYNDYILLCIYVVVYVYDFVDYINGGRFYFLYMCVIKFYVFNVLNKLEF